MFLLSHDRLTILHKVKRQPQATPYPKIQIFKGSTLNRKSVTKEKQLPIFSKAETNAFGAIISAFPVYGNKTVTDIENRLQSPENEQKQYSLSQRSKKKIREKINAFYQLQGKKRTTFVTLTFINDVDDQKAVKVLNKFLTVCRKFNEDFQYLWVAERQEETKRIHFHIITNVPKWDISYYNQLWLTQQNNAGITHEKDNLNPFDVKYINSHQGLSLYLTMYVTKNLTTFSCQPWNCSKIFSRLFTKMVIDYNQFNHIEEHEQQIEGTTRQTKHGLKKWERKIYVNEYATTIFILNKNYSNKVLHEMRQINEIVTRLQHLTHNDYIEAMPTLHHWVNMAKDNYTPFDRTNKKYYSKPQWLN